jgi:hypothetical protein
MGSSWRCTPGDWCDARKCGPCGAIGCGARTGNRSARVPSRRHACGPADDPAAWATFQGRRGRAAGSGAMLRENAASAGMWSPRLLRASQGGAPGRHLRLLRYRKSREIGSNGWLPAGVASDAKGWDDAIGSIPATIPDAWACVLKAPLRRLSRHLPMRHRFTSNRGTLARNRLASRTMSSSPR